MSSQRAVPGSVTVIGEALIDLVPSGLGGAMTAHPGGSPYNVAIGLARLGVDVSLMARLADNTFGRLLRERALREGVRLGAAVHARELTTLGVVSLDTQARATYKFYVQGTADWQWTDEEITRLPARTDILHFGSLASWTGPGDAQISALARRLHDAGGTIVSYDPNVRPQLLGTPAAARVRIEQSVALAHLVKASAEDIAWLYPVEPIDDVVSHWLTLGPALVVITDGPDGAWAVTAAGAHLARGGAQIDLVDTVGAGDAFTAALLASLLGRGVRAPRQLTALDTAELDGALDDAIWASALTCQRPGADPPTAAEAAGAADSRQAHVDQH